MKQSTFVSSALTTFAVLAGMLAQAPAQSIPLGSASSFALLAGSGITVAGAVNSTTITGDIGTFPTTSITGLGNVVLIGINHAGDAVTQSAKTDLVTAYNNAAGRLATTVATELGSTTKAAGVYDSASSTFTITGILTLDGGGDPNAVFIFKMGTTLTTATSSEVKLINGAQAGNVFWQVGSSATIGSSSIFKGNVLALTAITLGTSATVDGRLLARNAFTQLDGSNTIRAALTAQTITFAPIASHTACDAPFTFVLPTASSGLPVTLAVSGPATISGNTITLTGVVGAVVITSSQAGNVTFAAASNVTQSFAVTACALVPQTITFAPIASHTACDASFTFVLPTASSGLPVTLAVSGPATVSGNIVTLNGAIGTVVLTASQPGNGVFSAAANATQSFAVIACLPAPPPPTTQTITFAAISSHTACDSPFTFVMPTASSGLPVALAVSGPVTISGNRVTLTGAVGTVFFTASQAGNGTFAPAPNVTLAFGVVACAPGVQTITFAPILAHSACDAPFTFVYPLASSGLAVTLAVSGPAMVSAGNIVTLSGAMGTVVLTASQAGNATYAAAPNVTQSFAVGSCCVPPVITNTPLTASGVVGTPFRFAVTASGSPTSFAAFNLPPGLAIDAQTGVISGTPTEHDGVGPATAPVIMGGADTTPRRERTLGPTFVTLTATHDTCVSPPVYLMIVVAPAFPMPVITSATRVFPGPVGMPFAFEVTATGSPTSYEANNLPAGLTINSTTGAISGTPTTAGVSVVTLTATNGTGSGTALLTILVPPSPSSRIVNFSARGLSGPGSQSLIMGFVVSGNGKNLLVRGVGPNLSSLGVSNALADPLLTLSGPAGIIATNDDWQTTLAGQPDGSLLAPSAARIGAFALPNGSRDAALLATVDSGAYSVSLLRPNSTTGVALTEIYDLDTVLGARLINVSARVNVSTGEGMLIGGLVIAGNAPKTVLIRGIGPTLSIFAVTGLLADPTITVLSGSSQIATNDNWESGTSTPAQIVAASAQVGAFPLPAGSRDSALLVMLQPGAYTVQVTGVGNTAGMVLVEIYDTQ